MGLVFISLILLAPPFFGQLTKEAVLENPEVLKAKEGCDAHFQREKNYNLPGKEYADIGACIWGEISPGERERFLTEDTENKATTPTVEEAFSVAETPMEKKALDSLRKHLRKKLAEAIVSAAQTEGQRVFLGIQTVYELYEQALGKSVINAVTSFCIEAKEEGEGKYKISDNKADRQKQREIHLNKLNNFLPNGQTAAFRPWAQCISSIAPACYEDRAADTYTRHRACGVTHYLQALKKALVRTGEIKEALSTITSSSSLDLGVAIYRGNRGQTSINRATTLTSGEIPTEGEEELKEIYERCRLEVERETERASEECQKFVLSPEEEEATEAQEDMARFALETKIRLERMKKEREEGSKEEIEEMIGAELDDLGIPEEGREAYLADLGLTDPKAILKALGEEKYTREREALIAHIEKKLEERLAGESENNKIRERGEDVLGQMEEYRELIHFNNVVSSYLEIRSPDGEESSRNTASLALELENNAFNPDDIQGEERWGHLDYRTGEELMDQGAGASENEENPVLSPDQINFLLGGQAAP